MINSEFLSLQDTLIQGILNTSRKQGLIDYGEGGEEAALRCVAALPCVAAVLSPCSTERLSLFLSVYLFVGQSAGLFLPVCMPECCLPLSLPLPEPRTNTARLPHPPACSHAIMEVWDAQSPALFSALMDSQLLFRPNDGGEGHGGLARMATRAAPACTEHRISALTKAWGRLLLCGKRWMSFVSVSLDELIGPRQSGSI